MSSALEEKAVVSFHLITCFLVICQRPPTSRGTRFLLAPVSSPTKTLSAYHCAPRLPDSPGEEFIFSSHCWAHEGKLSAQFRWVIGWTWVGLGAGGWYLKPGLGFREKGVQVGGRLRAPPHGPCSQQLTVARLLWLYSGHCGLALLAIFKALFTFST